MANISIQFVISTASLFEILILALFYLIVPKLTILCLLFFIFYIILNAKILKHPSKIVKQKSMKCFELIPIFSEYHFRYTKAKIPYIGPKQVLIEVHLGAINPVDVKVNFSLIPFKRWLKSNIMGFDVCGKIIELGNEVTEFKIGETVFGIANSGSLAEYAVCNVHQIWKVSNEEKKEELGASVVTGVTSYQSLIWFFKENELAGKNILVIGASGGCGSIACQLAKFLKFKKVVGVCSDKNLNYVSTICDVAISYNYSDLDIKLKNEGKFDIILDTVSSGEDGDMHKKYIQFIDTDGKYIQLNGNKIDVIKGALASMYPFLKNLKGFEPKNFHCHLMNTDICQIGLKRLDEIFRDNNNIHVKLEKLQLNNDGLKAGFDKIKSRRTVGKIIFEIKPKNL